MAFSRQTSPTESDLLCESCGYILNGLDARPDGNCPECGEPLATSLNPLARKPAPIEEHWSPRSFWKTTASVLFRKRRFFRETLARTGDTPSVHRFGTLHRIAAGALFGLAAGAHLAYMGDAMLWTTQPRWTLSDFLIISAATLVLVALSILLLHQVTRLAIWMTEKESKWWGMRLPRTMLVRAMNFHAANYLPVGVLAVAITCGFRVLVESGVLTLGDAVPYLVLLSIAVVVSAIWLFESFVIAMRRIRLANY